MTFPLYLIDAFVDQPFSGNPAGVCLLPSEPSTRWMQQVALEMNQSETAFVWPKAEGSWELRWFTPLVEVNLCGHATLAAAHALWHHFSNTLVHDRIEFYTRSGLLTATRIGGEIQLDFPADQPRSRDLPIEIFQLLGKSPVWFGRGSEDILVILSSADEVEDFVPDLNLISSVTERGMILSAPGKPGSGLDMVSRFFAPRVGIAEDPVTGSAHCLLAVYWGYRLGKARMQARQASARGGLLTLKTQGNRVLLTGKARIMLTGEFHG